MARKITLLTYVWKEASWNFSVSGTAFLRSVFTIQVIGRVINTAKGLILQEGDNSSICSLILTRNFTRNPPGRSYSNSLPDSSEESEPSSGI